MVIANEFAFAGAFSQAKGMLFSIPLIFFSHLYTSNKRPLTTAVLVNLNPEVDVLGVGEVIEPTVVDLVTGIVIAESLLQAIAIIERKNKYGARLKYFIYF